MNILDGKSVGTWSSIGIYAFNDMASKSFFASKYTFVNSKQWGNLQNKK